MRIALVLCVTVAAVSAGLPSSRTSAQAPPVPNAPELVVTPSPAERVRGLYDTAYSASAALIREQAVEPAAIRFDGTLDLGSCHHDMPKSGSTLDGEVESAAYEMAFVRHTLNARGYDPAYYEKWVKSYEIYLVNILARIHFGGSAPARRLTFNDVVRQMEAQRSVAQPAKPRLTYNLNCNIGAEIPVLLRADPAGGRIWFLGLFHFKLCEVRKLDPWNRTQCAGWREAGSDNPVPMFGVLRLQGEWPGGRRLKGERTVKQATYEGRSLVLTVRPD